MKLNSTSSQQRRVRLNAMQADFATLQALQSSEIPRYQRLKRLIATRRIKNFIINRALARKAMRDQENSSATSNKGSGVGVLASNSLFVSTLPSSVGDGGANSVRDSFLFLDDDEEIDEEINNHGVQENGENNGRRKRDKQLGDESLLLDLTSATLTASIGSLLRRSADSDLESTFPGKEKSTEPAFSIAANQYAAVEASRLTDLQNKILSRAARRNGGDKGGGGTIEGEQRAAALTKYLESSGADVEKLKDLTMQLEKLRDRSDALIRKHLRPSVSSQQQQRNIGSSASEILHARRKKLGDRSEAYIARLMNPEKPKDVLEKSRTSPLSQIQKQLSDDALLRASQGSEALLSSDDESTVTKNQAPKGPRLPADFARALDNVRFPHATSDQAAESAHKTACIALDRSRRWWSVYDAEQGKSADLREIAPSPDGWPDFFPSASPQGGEPGKKAFTSLGYLPPKLKDLTPQVTEHMSPQDLMSNVFDKKETASSSATTGHSSVYAFEAGPDAKRIQPIKLHSSKETSEWWIAAACSSTPFFSHIGTEKKSTSIPSFKFGGAFLDKNTEVGSSSPDLSLETAMNKLGVLDAWSTAAAYIDPTAVKQEARESSAAAAAALLSNEQNEGSVANEPPSSAVATQSIEDLLSLSFELQSAPPFDFYGVASNARSASSGTSLMSSESGIPSRSNLATPSLATPAESVSSRVTTLFEALKRRLDTEDGGNLTGADGAPISSSQLARSVAARKIQHWVRGRKFVQSAKLVLAQKRENSAVVAKQKLNVIQSAMAQFLEALQNAGVVTGDDETASAIALAARKAISSNNGISSTPYKENATISNSKIPSLRRPGSAPEVAQPAQPYLRYQRPLTSGGRK